MLEWRKRTERRERRKRGGRWQEEGERRERRKGAELRLVITCTNGIWYHQQTVAEVTKTASIVLNVTIENTNMKISTV